jgi:hypothetical protein
MISRITHVHWRSRVRIHARANERAALHIQRWRPNGWTDRDPHWYKHSLGQSAEVMGVGVRIARAARVVRNYGGAVVPRKREAGEQARSAGVHEWNMAAQPPRARSAHSVEQNKNKLRNLRQTVRGSMRLMHVNTGMLKKRELYWQMLVYIYIYIYIYIYTSEIGNTYCYILKCMHRQC